MLRQKNRKLSEGKNVTIAIFATAILLVATVRTASAEECSYFNSETDKLLDGVCTLQTTVLNGHFAYILLFQDGTTVNIEYVKSSGANHIWRINGQPAMGYEISRVQLHGATLDLKQTVDWSEGAGQTQSQDAKSRPTTTGSNTAPQTNTTRVSDEVTKQMLYCVVPEAQYGQYSSFDGGKSAGKILEKCWKEALAFVDDCIKTEGHHDKETCQWIATITVQQSIKSFGK